MADEKQERGVSTSKQGGPGVPKPARERFSDWLLADFNLVRLALFLFALAGMYLAIEGLPPEKDITGVDRMLYWSFVVFVVGLGELFVLLIMLAVFGKIDLAMAFMDKDGLPSAPKPGGGKPSDTQTDPTAPTSQGPAGGAEASPYVAATTGSVSLSRLQAFLWTLIILVLYFHEAVRHKLDGLDGLPEVSPNLLFIMGMSSVVYLAGRQMTASKGKRTPL